MKWRLFSIITYLLYSTCTTFRATGITISKGARLYTECSYEESNNFYDVTSYYVRNARIESRNDTMDLDDWHLMGLAFDMTKGDNTILLLNGMYNPQPCESHYALEEFGLFLKLDAIIPGDTVWLEKDTLHTIFYFERSYDKLRHSGYTRIIHGALIVASICEDTISGLVSFSAETEGYIFSLHDDFCIQDTTCSSIKCITQFKAPLEKLKKNMSPVGHVWLDEDVY